MVAKEFYHFLMHQNDVWPSTHLGMNADWKHKCFIFTVEELEVILPLLEYISWVDVAMRCRILHGTVTVSKLLLIEKQT